MKPHVPSKKDLSLRQKIVTWGKKDPPLKDNKQKEIKNSLKKTVFTTKAVMPPSWLKKIFVYDTETPPIKKEDFVSAAITLGKPTYMGALTTIDLMGEPISPASPPSTQANNVTHVLYPMQTKMTVIVYSFQKDNSKLSENVRVPQRLVDI